MASGRGSAFVPAPRVSVLPQSQRLKDGYRTEAGEEFYFNLVAGVPALEEGDGSEPPESLQPREAIH